MWNSNELTPTMEAASDRLGDASRRKITNLDVALLRTFVAVVDLGGVAKAADHIGRSQPATSLQLKKLEEVIGGELFQKAGRGLAPTEMGDLFLSYARRMLELNDETVAALSTIHLSGNVRLGIAQDFAEDWLTGILARFSRVNQDVLIEVKSERNHVLREMIDQQKLDLALTFGDPSTPDAVDLGLVPVCWIGRPERNWHAAEPVPLVLFDPPCEFRRLAIEALDRAGSPWRLVFSSPSLSSQWSAVEAGMGISVRTPIGLRPPLAPLGPANGLPALPRMDLRILLHSGHREQDLVVRHLQQVLIETVREKFGIDGRSTPPG